MLRLSVVGVVAVAVLSSAAAVDAASSPAQTIVNGTLAHQAVLRDTAGNKIDAHGGHQYFFNGRYYWYGESYACGFALNRPTNFCGVRVYDSSDGAHWRARGLALDPRGEQARWNKMCGGSTFGCFRPKVAYNARNHVYVMWVNESLGSAGAGYLILTATQPAGPFILQRHVRMSYDRCRAPGNFSFGDEDLFVDDDGTGYLAYTSIKTNCGDTHGLASHNLVVERLGPGYMAGTGHYTVYNGSHSIEAPILFKRFGTYYLLYSDPVCPYCGSADTAYATTTNLSRPFSFRGRITPSRLGGQPTAVAPLAANGGVQYVFMLDRWRQCGSRGCANQYGGNYFFAPLSFGAGSAILPIPPVASWQSRFEDAAPHAAPFVGPPAGGGYVPLFQPRRVVDSRTGFGGVSGRIRGGPRVYTFRVGGVPAGATLALNVTAVGAAGAGSMVVWGAGPRPRTSTVNYDGNRPTAPNLAVVRLGRGNALHVAAGGAPAFVVADLQGYYPGRSSFVPVVPAGRIVDMRRTHVSIPANGARDVSLFAWNVVPRSAKSVAANVTVLSRAQGNLQGYSTDGSSSGESVRAVFGPGATANLAMFPVSRSGTIHFVNRSRLPVQLLLDVQGYDTGHAVVVFGNPRRLENSAAPHVGAYTAPLESGITYPFDARDAGVPETATAAVVEIAAASIPSGHLTAFTDANNVPGTSNINFSPGRFQSNLSVIPLRHGVFDAYLSAARSTNVSIDVVGYTS